MTVCDVLPTSQIKSETKEPSLYMVRLMSQGVFPGGAILMKDSFIKTLAGILHTSDDAVRKAIKVAVRTGARPSLGIFPKDVAETVAANASQLAKKNLCLPMIVFTTQKA